MSHDHQLPWDMRCQELLLLLSREDWHHREQVCGPALDNLLKQGLAEVAFKGKREDGGLDGIALTAMGWAEVARVQERHRITTNGEDTGNKGRPIMHQPVASACACSCGLAQLVIDMRRAQRRYFRAAKGTDEKFSALKLSQELERKVDKATAQFVAPGFDFGGGAT